MTNTNTRTFVFLFVFFFFFITGNVHSNTKAQSFDYKVQMTGFTPEQEEKITRALELIKVVVQSGEFKNRVINKKYKGNAMYVDSPEMDNEAVYRRIIAGAERGHNEEENHTMDLELELYTDLESKTIGYTYPSVKRIWMNSKYLNQFEPHQVADNLMHEWLHKLGFKHEVKYSSSRKHSVPYSVGYLIKELTQKQMQAQTAE